MLYSTNTTLITTLLTTKFRTVGNIMSIKFPHIQNRPAPAVAECCCGRSFFEKDDPDESRWS